VNPTNVYSATVSYTNIPYPHVEVRLADLYLLYAEALNEYGGPSDQAYEYIDLVRQRAGLNNVVDSWRDHSIDDTKPTRKDGLREIIHRERALELAFEGQRYWDLRRWKKAVSELNHIVKGWNIFGEEAPEYYTQRTLLNRKFNQRDYFWPIQELDLIVNKNLVQNPGWQ
ncbi:MAG TPA: RagB/SusD family nutrient uptake outer membrane protein, partial [Sphingobacterium sp.]|nr:RagB/SusD family nutrient uptake outer membrane protein [Sphingobacterium sp.]